MYNPSQFAEKYQLAVETALQSNLKGGLSGYEIEWNLLDSDLSPLLTVGSGPDHQSFVDFLRGCCLPPEVREQSKPEVFHWMIEWFTKPYYHLRGAVYEGRLLEAALIDTLHRTGADFGERLYYWHGNLLYLTEPTHECIPYSWHLAKRRYLVRCVDLYGDSLATAGTHTNLSLPEPLLAWDFMRLPASERRDAYLDDYKNNTYVTGARLLRAFAALFIAVSASTPFKAESLDGTPTVALTPYDSIRNLTFPNPATLDVPNLYRSHVDYLHISSDQVRRGVRFGNNNWAPVRARSFIDPAERLLATTSEQLHAIYARGLYAMGEDQPVEAMVHDFEEENLLACINIPMSRVEIRTDDGGAALEVDIANLTLKYLLLLRIYADVGFAHGFRYDKEDIARARNNERLAAQLGLRAEIANPLTGKSVRMREFLAWTLAEVRPLSEALGLWGDLIPLVEMSQGAPNTAERLRQRLQEQIGYCEVPLDVLRELAAEREAQVARDIEQISGCQRELGPEFSKLDVLLQHARQNARNEPLESIPDMIQNKPKAAGDECRFPEKASLEGGDSPSSGMERTSPKKTRLS